METIKTVFSSILLLLSVFTFAAILPSAHAATGLVCIADPTVNPASCPSSPPHLSAPAGSNVSVAVNIQGSDTLNGFDVAVQVAPMVLRPLGIFIGGSVIHDPRTIAVQSVNASNGIARLAMVANGYVVTGPVTGNLFTIVYNVLSSSSGTNITFQTGCSGTSVPNTCVTVVNAGTVDSETVQTATFGGAVTPDFTMQANPASQNVQQGFTAKALILVASINGFSGTVNLSTSPPPLCPSCPSWTLSRTSVVVTPGGTSNSTLNFMTVAGTPPNTYVVGVFGSGGTLSHNVTARFVVTVPSKPDFALSASPSSLSMTPGGNGVSTITVSSINGFSNFVNLNAAVFPAGIAATLASSSLLIPPNGTNSTKLTVTTSSSTSPGSYNVTVRGVSGSLSHATILRVTVQAFPSPGTVCLTLESSFSCPSRPTFFQGQTGTQLVVAVNVQNSAALNGFDISVLTDPSILQPVNDSTSGTVLQNIFIAKNNVNSTTGLVRLAAVSAGFITTAPTTGRFFSITYNIVGSTQGTFVLFPAACSGTSNDSLCVTVTNPNVPGGIDPENILEANFTSTQPADFLIGDNPSSLTIVRGQSGSSIITLSSLFGFSGTVSLSASITPVVKKGPGITLSPSSIALVSGGTGTSTLLISTSPATATGTYMVTITGTSGSLTHSVTLTITVISKH